MLCCSLGVINYQETGSFYGKKIIVVASDRFFYIKNFKPSTYLEMEVYIS